MYIIFSALFFSLREHGASPSAVILKICGGVGGLVWGVFLVSWKWITVHLPSSQRCEELLSGRTWASCNYFSFSLQFNCHSMLFNKGCETCPTPQEMAGQLACMSCHVRGVSLRAKYVVFWWMLLFQVIKLHLSGTGVLLCSLSWCSLERCVFR